MPFSNLTWLRLWESDIFWRWTRLGERHVWGMDTFWGRTRFWVYIYISSARISIYNKNKFNNILMWLQQHTSCTKWAKKTNVFVYGMVIVRTNLVSHRKVMGSFTNPLLLQKPGICKYCDFVNFHVLLH